MSTMSDWFIHTFFLSLRILVVTETNEHNVRLVYPHLLPELASDVTKPLHAIETHRLEAAVAQHLGHLGILLAVLFEDQFSLKALVLILSPPPVLSSFSLVLRHLALKG